MIFEFLFFYSKDTDYEKILKHIQKYPKNTKIITNRTGLNAFLRNNNKKSFMIAEAVPETGQIGEESYDVAIDFFKEYEKELINIKHFGISTFAGYSYSLLRKLYLLAQSKKILDNKENIIFIFENYSSIYYSVTKLATKLGYDNKTRIGFINKGKINYSEINQSIYLQNISSHHRLLNFQKINSSTLSINDKIKSYSRFSFKIFSLILSKLFFKIKMKLNNNNSSIIIKNIEKKIKMHNSELKMDTIFFITTTRLDLYLKPWIPIFEKYKKEGKKFLIITSDLAISLLLSREKIQHINIFEEMRFLQEFLKNDNKVNEIKKMYDKSNLKKNPILGTNAIFNDILNDTLRSMAIIEICEFIIRKVEPKSLVAMADGEMLECLAIETAKKAHIPTYSSSPTLPNLHPLLKNWFHAEKIFIDGTKHVDTFIKLGYDKDRFLLVGNPKYDIYINSNIQKAKKFLEHHHKINSKKKLLVVAMSKWRKDDDKWMSKLIHFCNKNEIEIIFKIHPKFKIGSQEISTKMNQEIKNKCVNLKYMITYDVELLELIPAADLVVTDYSSVGLEAVIARKPLISINLFNEDYEVFNDLRVDRYGASLYVENYDEFEDKILEILKQNQHIKELKINQEKIVDRYNYFNDGKTVDRIYEQLLAN